MITANSLWGETKAFYIVVQVDLSFRLCNFWRNPNIDFDILYIFVKGLFRMKTEKHWHY